MLTACEHSGVPISWRATLSCWDAGEPTRGLLGVLAVGCTQEPACDSGRGPGTNGTLYGIAPVIAAVASSTLVTTVAPTEAITFSALSVTSRTASSALTEQNATT